MEHGSSAKTLGLYLHIPFCRKKCLYCDFYSIPAANEQLKQLYLDALLMHLDEHILQFDPYLVDSVYIGGGTPSLLSEKQLSSLMKRIRRNFHVTHDCEVTIEVNPGTVDKNKLSAFRRAGVNRLSIGCQSFYDTDLKVCGRIHTAQDNVRVLDDAASSGFQNINVDIMYGLPNQNLENVLGSLDRAMKLGAKHISLYGLKIEEGTPFYTVRSKLRLPDEDRESEMYFVSCEMLRRSGFQHYEISNFAKPGFQSVHNLKYWNCREYVGFGPAAHSFFSGKRFSYKKSLALYIKNFTERYEGPGIVDQCIDIPFGAQMAEYVMLRMRLGEGVDCEEFRRRFGRSFESVYQNKMGPFLKSGHIVKTQNGYAFTEQGMYVSNYILARMIDFDMVIPGI